MEEQAKFDISEHLLVPKHTKLKDDEKQVVLNHYNISIQQLPQIKQSDPALSKIPTNPGDVIKIVRKSPTTGETAFYRVVING